MLKLYFFTDRKKDLVKLQMGEYVSLGKVESVLKNHHLIDNICVYGESTKNYCIAFIVPQSDHLTKLAKNIGVTDKTFEDICDDPNVIKAVLHELETYGKQGKY